MEWLRETASTLRDLMETDTISAVQRSSTGRGAPIFKDIIKAAQEVASENDLKIWKLELEELIDLSHQAMQNASSVDDLHDWRTVYTDCSILKASYELTLGEARRAISTLDYSIIIAGAAGDRRFHMVHHLIQRVQTTFFAKTAAHALCRAVVTPSQAVVNIISTADLAIPRLSLAPSFLSFLSQHSRHPFIVPGYAKDWPALQEHSWLSAAYLRSVAGPGRVVPVEVGKHYLTEHWKPVIMGWDEFLSSLDLDGQVMSRQHDETLYLAQHNLFMQFPGLRDDIIIPDYAYTSLASDDFPSYRPPDNDERLILNAWLGPKNTISPAHIDPYNNLYVQVIGRKTVWLAPPSMSEFLQFQPKPEADKYGPASADCRLKNNSTCDVFDESEDTASYLSRVVPHAMSATLNPGDLLYLPVGWWHAMRSEDTSFSVSIWF